MHGLDRVRLEAIADAADIARGTLYSHFPTKEALVGAIVRPALEHAVAALSAIDRGRGVASVDAVLGVWVELWCGHRDALRVMQHARAMPLGELSPLHGALMEHILPVFAGAAARGALRGDDPARAALMLARLAMPLLELCGEGPKAAARFKDAMHGLLLRC
ncbi:MAG: TetR/AcrR family transcriptional regulator [Polyangiaceae bacterium]|nr:TetR/AcrR family transcriptional regulator [Polyangiaceae bacterium]